MEIRNERINTFKPIPRINKYFRPSAGFPDKSPVIRHRFQSPRARCSHGYNPAALTFRLINDIRRFPANHIKFRVHMMIGHIFHLHRPEGAKAHMQRYSGNPNSLFLNIIQKLFREMKSGRRRRRAALMLRINCLITVFILKFMTDIRRQRHFAKPVKNLLKNSVIFEADKTVSFLHDFHNLADKQTVAKGNPGPRTGLFPRFHQGFPNRIALPL